MAEGDQEPVATSSAPAAPAQPPPTANDATLSPAEEQLEMVSMERDDYRRKLETVEAELAALIAASPDADTINKLQQDNDNLRRTLKRATDMLREKITSCNMQEKKNSALTQQVSTLKEVLQVTRDLLNIRNMEVEELQKNVDAMESRIDENRKRQSAMIKQIEQATQINGQLRTEYETQLEIFQSLKERYEEKVTALTNIAYERQRQNSEGSEKFEDAAGEPENETEQGVISEIEVPVDNSNASGLNVPDNSEPGTLDDTQKVIPETTDAQQVPVTETTSE